MRSAEPTMFQKLGGRLMLLQRDINRLITRQMVEIKAGRSSLALVLGFAIAFLYGAAHAAGPGHGKAVVVSYFLSRDAGILKGLWMAGLIALCHVAAAIVIVLAAQFVLEGILSKPVNEMRALKIVSYGAITAIGFWMFATTARRWFVPSADGSTTTGRSEEGTHHCGCGVAADHRYGGVLSFAVGLIPCSGAVLILVYSLANGIVASGILMTFGIGLGMTATLAAVGVASIYTRRRAVALAANGNARRGEMLQTVFGAVGALLITGLGGILLAGSFT
ncbi:hypothetical protein [Rhodospirillaceae bacterium SYSU D60014]|uniref:nickel/cobalt transporter n=1 Tax=Virgifigura deserti TaxID=2268457 RepID=UPI0013C4DE75